VAPTTVPVTLTPTAVTAAKRVRESEGLSAEHGLRVSVVGGGCSGFSYQLSFDRQRQDGDLEGHFDGLSVWVDPTSAQYLEGTQIDFVSSLNAGHKKWAWASLLWVAFSDIYVRLCSMGIWHDWRIL